MPKVFKYHPPPIPSAGVYYFTSDAGVDYEVRFGRKQGNILAVNIVFGVLNDEYDGEEYVLTNKGEFYSVMATLQVIIADFQRKNQSVHTYEFSGEPRDESESLDMPTKRTTLYLKYSKKIFPISDWKHTMSGNKVSIERL
ncbi:MAG: hypothetical protein HQ500_13580 [Flavobacteriales bacterium]|nr:hypothetical protein [Flavobacteriales bacterium]